MPNVGPDATRAGPRKTVAVIGGSFDPPTLAHLMVASQVSTAELRAFAQFHVSVLRFIGTFVVFFQLKSEILEAYPRI